MELDFMRRGSTIDAVCRLLVIWTLTIISNSQPINILHD